VVQDAVSLSCLLGSQSIPGPIFEVLEEYSSKHFCQADSQGMGLGLEDIGLPIWQKKADFHNRFRFSKVHFLGLQEFKTRCWLLLKIREKVCLSFVEAGFHFHAESHVARHGFGGESGLLSGLANGLGTVEVLHVKVLRDNRCLGLF